MLPDFLRDLDAAVEACGFAEHREAIRAAAVPCVALDELRPAAIRDDPEYVEESDAIGRRFADVPPSPERKERINAMRAEARGRAHERQRARRDAALPIGFSRVGGVPEVSPGFAWPEQDGVPMSPVAQIDLDALPRWDGCPLPATGWLYAFAGEQFADDFACRVLWLDVPRETLRQPDGGSPAETFGLLPLRPRPGYVFDQHAATDVDVWEVHGHLASTDAAGLDGGNVATLLGAVEWEDSSARQLAAWRGRDEADWVNLLTVRSIGSMTWSDCGHLNLLIRRSDLLARRFDDLLWAAPGN